MNYKNLCALIALSLGTLTVQAAEYPDGWYFAPYIGINQNDNERYVDSDQTVLLGVGLGRYIAPNSTLELSLDRTSRDMGSQYDYVGTSTSTDLLLSLRHFIGERDWRPYVMAGVGVGHHRSRDQLFPSNSISGPDAVFQVGLGLQRAFNDSMPFRLELGYRHDMDDETVPGQDSFGDLMLNFAGILSFGGSSAAEPAVATDPADIPAEPAPAAAEPAPAAEAPPVTEVADSDGDGVADADDKCPGTPAGEAVGPDGCPVAVVIDLRGVNFDFDKSELRPDAIALLDQAIDVLNRYPSVNVEVAGHTDSIGTDEYNQGLSERRANAVYQYLIGHGIPADRLSGPNGYGEGRPIDTNNTSEGRARNRRTELVREQQ